MDTKNKKTSDLISTPTKSLSPPRLDGGVNGNSNGISPLSTSPSTSEKRKSISGLTALFHADKKEKDNNSNKEKDKEKDKEKEKEKERKQKEEDDKELRYKLKELEKQRNKEHEKEEKEKQKLKDKEEKERKHLEKQLKKQLKKNANGGGSSKSTSNTNTATNTYNSNGDDDDSTLQTDTSTYSTRSIDFDSFDHTSHSHYGNNSTTSSASNSLREKEKIKRNSIASDLSNFVMKKLHVSHSHKDVKDSNQIVNSNTSHPPPPPPPLITTTTTTASIPIITSSTSNSNLSNSSKSTPTSPTKIGFGSDSKGNEPIDNFKITTPTNINNATTTTTNLSPFPLGQHRGNSKLNIFTGSSSLPSKPSFGQTTTYSSEDTDCITDESDSATLSNATVIELPSLSIDPPRVSSPTQQLKSPPTNRQQQPLSSPFVVSTPSSSVSPYIDSTNVTTTTPKPTITTTNNNNQIHLSPTSLHQHQLDSCSSSPKTFISHSPSIPLFLQQQADIDIYATIHNNQSYPQPPQSSNSPPLTSSHSLPSLSNKVLTTLNESNSNNTTTTNTTNNNNIIESQCSEETLQKSAICKRRMEDFYSYLFECEKNSRYNPLLNKRKIVQKKSMLELNLKNTLNNKNKLPLHQLLFGNLSTSATASTGGTGQPQSDKSPLSISQHQPVTTSSNMMLTESSSNNGTNSNIGEGESIHRHIFNKFHRDHKRSYSTNTPPESHQQQQTTNSPQTNGLTTSHHHSHHHQSASNLETVLAGDSEKIKRKNILRKKLNPNRFSLTLSHSTNRNSSNNLEGSPSIYSNDTTNSNSIPPSSASQQQKQPFNILPSFGKKIQTNIKGLFNEGIGMPTIQMPSFQLKKNTLFSFGKHKKNASSKGGQNDEHIDDGSHGNGINKSSALSKNINSVLDALSNDNDEIKSSSDSVQFQRPRNRQLAKAYREMLQLTPKVIEISQLKSINDRLESKVLAYGLELDEFERKQKSFTNEVQTNFKLLNEASESSKQFVLANQERQFIIHSKLEKTKPYIDSTLNSITKLFEKSKSLENTVQLLRRSSKKTSPYINILFKFFMISYIIFVFNFIVNKLSVPTSTTTSSTSSPSLPSVNLHDQQDDSNNSGSVDKEDKVESSGKDSGTNDNSIVVLKSNDSKLDKELIQPTSTPPPPLPPQPPQIQDINNTAQTKVMKMAKFNLEAMSKSIAMMREKDQESAADFS